MGKNRSPSPTKKKNFTNRFFVNQRIDAIRRNNPEGTRVSQSVHQMLLCMSLKNYRLRAGLCAGVALVFRPPTAAAD
jgi:hypothetical protein